MGHREDMQELKEIMKAEHGLGTRHKLKIWPQYFSPVLEGRKTFEVRMNDRGFQVGDEVELQEWDPIEVETPTGIHPHDKIPFGSNYTMKPQGYTGRSAVFTIGYVFPIDDKRVVFSLTKFLSTYILEKERKREIKKKENSHENDPCWNEG